MRIINRLNLCKQENFGHLKVRFKIVFKDLKSRVRKTVSIWFIYNIIYLYKDSSSSRVRLISSINYGKFKLFYSVRFGSVRFETFSVRFGSVRNFVGSVWFGSKKIKLSQDWNYFYIEQKLTKRRKQSVLFVQYITNRNKL